MKNDGSLATSFAVMEPDTYLIIEAGNAELIEYCAQMNERNHIPGILDMQRQFINGELQLYYNITRKRKITSQADQKELNREQGEKIFRSLIRTFHELPEYFLRPGMCLLELEYLFVDSSWNTFFPLLPFASAPKDSSGELRDFFLSLLGTCFAEQDSDPYFDQMLKYLIRPGFSLEGFEKLAVPESPESEEQKPVKPIQPQKNAHAPLVPENPSSNAKQSIPDFKHKSKEAKLAAPSTPEQVLIPGSTPGPVGAFGKTPVTQNASVHIPGVVQNMEQNKPEDKPKKKKGERKLFGLFSFGEKKKPQESPPNVPKLDMNKESHIISQVGQGGRAIPSDSPDRVRGAVRVQETDAEESGTILMGRSEPSLTHRGRRIPLSSFPFSIGQTAGCSYSVNNPKVSHMHATISIEDGVYYIQDEASLNHTYVDGSPIPPYTPYPLNQNAVLRLANEEFLFDAGDKEKIE